MVYYTIGIVVDNVTWRLNDDDTCVHSRADRLAAVSHRIHLVDSLPSQGKADDLVLAKKEKRAEVQPEQTIGRTHRRVMHAHSVTTEECKQLVA